MNLKMKTLAAAVIATAAMSTANANSLLFPYFSTLNGAQSVISLASASTLPASPATNNIHYVYNYGPSCAHFDGYGTMTPGDLMQHSVASPTAAGGPGFGKVVGSDTSRPFYFSLNGTQGHEGFVVVYNTTIAGTPGTTTAAIDLVGSMVVADPASGLMFTYKAISSAAAATQGGDFSNITDLLFTTSWYPDAVANTSWAAIVAGNMNNAIVAGRDWTARVNWNNGGHVRDNDEALFSGTSGNTITCRGTILRDAATASATAASGLMTPAQNAAINNGGINRTTFTSVAGGIAADVSTGVILAKIETVLPAVGAPFAGRSLMHIENNLQRGAN